MESPNRYPAPPQVYAFTLTLSGVTEITPEMAEAIFAAGCDDCTPGSSEGVVTIEFHRDAETLSEAVGTAIRDVEKAGLNVARIEVEPADE